MNETTLSTRPATGPATVLADRTIGFRRRASAIAIPAGFAFQAVCNALYAISVADGGNDSTGTKTLELYGNHATGIAAATAFAIVGVAIILPGAFAAARVMRNGSGRLALIAAFALAVGYLGYLVNISSNFLLIELGSRGTNAASAIDGVSATPAFLIAGLLFVLGNLGGAVLLAIAMLRSRGVPKWAGILVFGWPVLHITNLIVGNEWFAVAGGVLQVIGLSALTSIALRMSNTQWASRG